MGVPLALAGGWTEPLESGALSLVWVGAGVCAHAAPAQGSQEGEMRRAPRMRGSSHGGAWLASWEPPSQPAAVSRSVPTATSCAARSWAPSRCASSSQECPSCAWASTTRSSSTTRAVSTPAEPGQAVGGPRAGEGRRRSADCGPHPRRVLRWGCSLVEERLVSAFGLGAFHTAQKITQEAGE